MHMLHVCIVCIHKKGPSLSHCDGHGHDRRILAAAATNALPDRLSRNLRMALMPRFGTPQASAVVQDAENKSPRIERIEGIERPHPKTGSVETVMDSD